MRDGSLVDSKLIKESIGKTIVFRRFQSGGKVETLYFAIVDLYGNLLTTDSNAMLFVKDNNDTKQLMSNGDLEYMNSISGTFYTSQQGIFTVDSLVLASQPDTN